ncbi:MAG: c-type cytochrome [Dehalococcoidia bacterium]
MLRRSWILRLAFITVVLATAIVLGACTGDDGTQGATGAPGPQGPEGPAPSADDIKAAVQEFLAPGATAESIAAGGRLYDKWWAEDAGATEPTADFALWELQTNNTRNGSTSWRCKECHGWDYKGKGGAYSSGSHYTGFVGPYQAGATMTNDDLVAVLQGATDYRHDFSSELSEQSLDNLADFLKYGLINDTMYIDYATKTPLNVDATNGQARYEQTCSACHGADGRLILFGGEDGVGNVANDNPWEFAHKVRAGQPGTAMPSAIVSGWSIEDVMDVLGYSQSLPTE